MYDEHLPMPHAVILQRLTGTGVLTFKDICDTLRAQGIEPPFLRDPRVISAALDDLLQQGLVWCINAHLSPTENDVKFVRANDPSPASSGPREGALAVGRDRP